VVVRGSSLWRGRVSVPFRRRRPSSAHTAGTRLFFPNPIPWPSSSGHSIPCGQGTIAFGDLSFGHDPESWKEQWTDSKRHLVGVLAATPMIVLVNPAPLLCHPHVLCARFPSLLLSISHPTERHVPVSIPQTTRLVAFDPLSTLTSRSHPIRPIPPAPHVPPPILQPSPVSPSTAPLLCVSTDRLSFCRRRRLCVSIPAISTNCSILNPPLSIAHSVHLIPPSFRF
jgi:hypothetical protein